MNKLELFLAWYDGFRENVAGRPSEKQWKRIAEEIEALRAVAALIPGMIGVGATPARVNGQAHGVGATTETADMGPPEVDELPRKRAASAKAPEEMSKKEWLSIFTGRMIELGCDLETAKDFARDDDLDRTSPPELEAKRKFGQWGTPAAA